MKLNLLSFVYLPYSPISTRQTPVTSATQHSANSPVHTLGLLELACSIANRQRPISTPGNLPCLRPLDIGDRPKNNWSGRNPRDGAQARPSILCYLKLHSDVKHYEGRRHKVSLHFIANPVATLEHCVPIAPPA